jgi:hypothetical protein
MFRLRVVHNRCNYTELWANHVHLSSIFLATRYSSIAKEKAMVGNICRQQIREERAFLKRGGDSLFEIRYQFRNGVVTGFTPDRTPNGRCLNP